MADDGRRLGHDEEEEPKIKVRDRRRVDLAGELREVEPDEPETSGPSEVIVKGHLVDTPPAPTPSPAAAPPEPAPAEAPAPAPAPADEPARPRRGGALGGAEEARVRRGPLRDVDAETLAAAEAAAFDDGAPDDGAESGGEPGEQRQISNVYEYVQVLAGEMNIWSLSAMGLMANPMTGLVTTDIDQAKFAVEVADALIDTLGANEKVPEETVLALCQNMVVQYGSVAAQLLNQPPQSRLQELSKVRFCIDTANLFFTKLQTLIDAGDDPDEKARLAELQNFLGQLRMAFVQSSGGGGIVG